MKFLFREGERLYRPTKVWLQTHEDAGAEDWDLLLARPDPEPSVHVRQVNEIKEWMLSEGAERRTWKITERRARYYDRTDVFERYLRALSDRVGTGREDERLWILMPALMDNTKRERYVRSIQNALPGAGLLSEPEMVLEYFRLVQQTLPMEVGRNNVFLVIDVGAATCNLTFALSNRDGSITEGSKGDQRTRRLRPVHSDSRHFAGRWVDSQLAQRIGLVLPNDVERRAEVLDRLEEFKIFVATRDVARGVEGADRKLDVHDLEVVSKALWDELGKLYREAADRLYQNLTSTVAAFESNRARLTELGIESGAEVHRMIDAVILAGGTSQLPGFEEAMQAQLFPDQKKPRILRVGEAFAIAGATGALAHVLHQRQPDGQPHIDLSEPFDQLDGVLPFDLTLTWRDKRSGKGRIPQGSTTVLRAGDPAALQKGEYPISGWIEAPKGTRLRLFLSEQGRPKIPATGGQDVEIESDSSRLWLVWDPETRRARLKGEGVANASAVHFDVNRVAPPGAPHPPRRKAVSKVPMGRVRFGTSNDIVIDVGMSKTVAVTAQAGLLDVREFERSAGLNGFVPDKVAANEIAVTPVPGGQPSPELEAPHDPAKESGQQVRGVESHTPAPVAPVEVPAEPPAAKLPAVEGEKSQDAASAADSGQDEQPTPEGSHDDSEPDPGPGPSDKAGFGAGGGGDPHSPSVVDEPDQPGQWQRIREALLELDSRERRNLYLGILAMLTRPFVLIAGPPGAGKSTMVDNLSRLMGFDESTFKLIHVQAHWRDGSALDNAIGADDDRVDPAVLHKVVDSHRMILLDEMNLTRPEHYAWDRINATRLPETEEAGNWIFGTLNIDLASRPPSPKVLDRAFLLELDAPEIASFDSISRAPAVGSLATNVTKLIPASLEPIPTEARRILEEVVQAIRAEVDGKHLRQDLLPSHRAMRDLERFVRLHVTLDPGGEIVSEDDIVDNLIAGRVLTRISGAAEQVESVINALDKIVNDSRYPKSRRRLAVAKSQLKLGFCSPWQ